MSLVEPRTITVAELIRRSAPASDLDHNCAEPIPVSALLQRERRPTGDAPWWPDRPRAPEPIAWPTNHGLLVRRAAIAAGALLAAGCVFGLTAALHHTAEQPTVSGTFAGQEVPEGTAAEAPTPALDGGSAAPVSWVPAALPTTLTSSSIAQPIAAAATGSTSAHATAVRPAAGGTTEGRTSTSTSSAAASTTHHSTGAAATTDAHGDTVSRVGANPDADTDGADVTRAVTTTVPHVSRTHTKTTAPLTTTTSPPTTTAAAPTTDPSTTAAPTTTTDPPTTDPSTTDPPTTTTDPPTTTAPPTTARLTSSAPTSESTAPTTSGVAKTEDADATP